MVGGTIAQRSATALGIRTCSLDNIGGLRLDPGFSVVLHSNLVPPIIIKGILNEIIENNCPLVGIVIVLYALQSRVSYYIQCYKGHSNRAAL